MKIAFHLDNLSLRGTTTAVLDYAKYNEELLKNKSIICYDKSLLSDNRDQNFSKRFEISDMFKSKYDVIEYDNKNQLKKELDDKDCDHIYFLKSGFVDQNYLEGKKNLIHCVFNHYNPHGHKYAYVSKWLADEASKGSCDYVPHIVSLPAVSVKNLRNDLKISTDKIVVGRYGGLDQFDIPFAHEVIKFFVDHDPSFVFLFVNTRKFIDHPNVIFLDPIINPQDKTDFISACDAMIHARSDGESFGLSVCEFLYLNRPVISFGGGRDKHHVSLLKDYDLIYNTPYEMIENMFKLKHNMYNVHYENIVEQFSPNHVMTKFKEVFLDD